MWSLASLFPVSQTPGVNMPDYEKERELIKLAENAALSSMKQTHTSIQNQMITANDMLLQQAAHENIKLSEAFRMNALFKAGVPLPLIKEVLPPQPSQQPIPLPVQLTPKPSLLKTVALPVALVTGIGLSAFGIGTAINPEQPSLVSPVSPVEKLEEGSLFQYLQDNSYHLKEN